MGHSAPRRFSGQAALLARCAAAILFVALGMSMGPSGAMATPYLVIVIETPEHHLGNNDGNEGTAFEKTFVVGRPLPHPEVVFDITQAFWEAPPRVSLNGAYLGSLSPFFPPFSDPLWRTWDDGTHDYMGTFDVGLRLPLRCGSARTRSGSRTGATMTTTTSRTSASRTDMSSSASRWAARSPMGTVTTWRTCV